MRVRSSILLTVLALVLSAGAIVFAWLQFESYENGMLEVYAEQQDDIVKLAASTLSELDGGEEGIAESVAGLNMSHGEFWTLAKDERLLFVKDTSDTNRYRGMPDVTYYDSQSARSFVSSLDVSSVRHSIIELNGVQYIASGCVFERDGASYEICQLTLKDVVTNNNSYMTAVVNLWAAIGVFVMLFLGTALFMGSRNDALKRTVSTLEAEKSEIYMKVEELDHALSARRIYDVKHSVFEGRSFPAFYDRLIRNAVWPTTFIMTRPISPQAEAKMLSAAQELFDQSVIRFRMNDGFLMFAFVECDYKAAKEAVEMLDTREFDIVGAATLHGMTAITAQDLTRRLEANC